MLSTKTSSKSNNEEGGRRSSRRRSSKNSKGLFVDTKAIVNGSSASPSTPDTVASTPGAMTPAGRRGSKDLRSPGITNTPNGVKVASPDDPLPDFITQTDKDGNAVTPRSKDAIETARVEHPVGPKPALHVDNEGHLTEDPAKDSDNDDDACDSMLDSFRLMCCCLGPDTATATVGGNKSEATNNKDQQHDTVSEGSQDNKTDCVKLLSEHHPDDVGKKCLVLDLDETLVHSSFRAVPGADFVIPVQVGTGCMSLATSYVSVVFLLFVTRSPSILFYVFFGFLLLYRSRMWFTLFTLPSDPVLMNS